MREYLFPDGFLWGAATASYQIEGSPRADGKGESIWDRFTHTPGKIYKDENADIACDHYRLFEQDVEMMAGIGLNAYRFSLSWPRIFPQGKGKMNTGGLDFYRRLIDRLQERGIKPAVTLYHWDLPQALQDRGGWNNRDTALYFAEYASSIFNSLDLPVDRWITLNEPWVAAFHGHSTGIHAPGLNDFNVALQASHNLLLGHGLAVRRFREAKRAGEEIGITLFLTPVHPATDSSADRDAARRTDGFVNRWFLDPLFRGAYPRDMVELYARLFNLPRAEEEDARVIAEPLDFLGINNYTRYLVRGDGSADSISGDFINPPQSEYTEMGWEVYPAGLYELLTAIHRDYGPLPLYITENGAAFADSLNTDGTVNDPRRISYLREYLLQAWKAVEEGIPLKGYFVWTLIDNFEWSFGFSKRFGLVYVDFETQKRYLKDSAHWYSEVCGSNGVKL